MAKTVETENYKMKKSTVRSKVGNITCNIRQFKIKISMAGLKKYVL